MPVRNAQVRHRAVSSPLCYLRTQRLKAQAEGLKHLRVMLREVWWLLSLSLCLLQNGDEKDMLLSGMEETKTAHAPVKQDTGTLCLQNLTTYRCQQKQVLGMARWWRTCTACSSGSEFGSQHTHLMARQSYIIPTMELYLKPLAMLGAYTHVHSNTGKYIK